MNRFAKSVGSYLNYKSALLAILTLGSSLIAVHGHQSLESVHFSAAFLLPVFDLKQGHSTKKYVLFGREAGGWDVGTFCAGGGSRDNGEKPYDTAAREFREEMISPWSQNKMVNYIDSRNDNTKSIMVYGMSNRIIVGYITHFSYSAIRDIKENFDERRRGSYLWRYREMDQLAMVAWNDLRDAILKCSCNKGVKVRALIWNPKTKQDEPEMITLRPVQVAMLRPYLCDEKNKTRTYTPGIEPKVRFYN
jgi:predicted NUDIX family NTP pyrophosphohydrolase